MRRSLLKAIALISSMALVLLSAWRGSSVPFHEQWPLYEALRNTAAIIFAVIGAWLAIVYPERLKVSLRGGVSAPDKPENASRVVALMTPVVHSTFILAAVLLVGIAAPLIRTVAAVQANVAACRGASYALLTALTLWQLWTVVLTLVPASEVTDQANQEDAIRRTASSVLSRTSRKSGDRA